MLGISSSQGTESEQGVAPITLDPNNLWSFEGGAEGDPGPRRSQSGLTIQKLIGTGATAEAVDFHGVAQGQTETIQITSSFPDQVNVTLTLKAKSSSAGQASFAGNLLTTFVTLAANQSTTVPITGVATSSTADDIILIAKVNGKGLAVSKPFSVVSVALSFKGDGNPTPGDVNAMKGLRDNTFLSSQNLGKALVILGTNQGCDIATEATGQVTPANYKGNVFLLRWVMHERSYIHTTLGFTQFNSPIDAASLTDPNTFDTTAVNFLQIDPQIAVKHKGGKSGQVFAVDAPGIFPTGNQQLVLRQIFPRLCGT